MATDSFMDLETVKMVMKETNKSDVWGTTEGVGMFGNYPNRGATPWSTTNGEYGRFMRGQRSGRNEGEAGSACGDRDYQGERDVGSGGSGAYYGQSMDPNSYEMTQEAGGTYQEGQADARNADQPPIDDGRYLIASRPMQSFPEMSDYAAATDARHDLKTGAGKRFMVQECNRFWNNMKSLNGKEGDGGNNYSWETDTQVLKIEDGGDTYAQGNDVTNTGSDDAGVYTQNDYTS